MENSLKNIASYDDYNVSQFKIKIKNNGSTTIIKGEGSPMRMDTEGISINIHDFKKGSFFIQTSKEKIHSIFVLAGDIQLDGKKKH